MNVEITLGEGEDQRTYILQPKLSAMKAINRMAGGYTGAFRRLQDYDADAMALIIIAGTGAVGKGAKEIEEHVYANGVDGLLVPLVRFVNICAAGGKDPDLKKAADDEAQDGKN